MATASLLRRFFWAEKDWKLKNKNERRVVWAFVRCPQTPTDLAWLESCLWFFMRIISLSRSLCECIKWTLYFPFQISWAIVAVNVRRPSQVLGQQHSSRMIDRREVERSIGSFADGRKLHFSSLVCQCPKIDEKRANFTCSTRVVLPILDG